MNETLWAEAVLGRDAMDFLATELGRYIVGRAEEEEKLAIDELATVSTWRRNRIRQLQNSIWRARSMRQWLGELIQAGKTAEKLLDDDRSEDE